MEAQRIARARGADGQVAEPVFAEEEAQALVGKDEVAAGWVDAVVLAGAIDAGRQDRLAADRDRSALARRAFQVECFLKDADLLAVAFDSGVFAIEGVGLVVVDEQTDIGVEVDVAVDQVEKRRTSSLITDISPGIAIAGEGDRVKLRFDYRMHSLYYTDNSSRNNIQNSLNIEKLNRIN